MISATQDTYPTLHTIANEDDDDEIVDEDVPEVVETALTLMSMRNVLFGFSTNTNMSKSNSSKRKCQQENGNDHKLLSDEELSGLLEIVKVEDDYLEIVCTCTSKMHGHYVGHLKVFRDGKLLIDCKCIPGCDLENATPEQFVTHARAKLGPREWRRCIWVYDSKGGRILLKNSTLLRHFETAGMMVAKRVKFRTHRDEFLKCMKCGIDRRFKLKSGDECREYHEAFLMKDLWTCYMHPRHKVECGSEGERGSRKLVRGCTRNGTCRGCSMCACYGCIYCRFSDCGCRICMDFTGRRSSMKEVVDLTEAVGSPS